MAARPIVAVLTGAVSRLGHALGQFEVATSLVKSVTAKVTILAITEPRSKSQHM